MGKKARVRWLAAVILLLVLCVTGCLVYRRWEATFTPEKWLAAGPPSSLRQTMLNDLLSKHPVTGLTQEEVTALLGGSDGSMTGGGRNIVTYYLGTKKEDGAVTYLYLFLKNGVVTEYQTVLKGLVA